jgi:catalase
MSIRAIFGAVLILVAPIGAALSEDNVGIGVVDAMNKLFGKHEGFRAFHAKGTVVEGSFKGTSDGAALSKAAIFNGTSIPVTVRFSDNGGFPNIADGAADANPRGMAIKFRVPDGSETDMVTNTFKVFPVPTAADLRDLFLAAAASPPDAPKPTELDKFVAAHATVGAAAKTLGTPDSFAHEEYRGLNAFLLVDTSGRKRAVRWILVPERVVHIDPADAAKWSPNYLMDEIRARLAKGPVTFRLEAQMAEPGDPTSDPSKAWPEDRSRISIGVLTLDKAVNDSEQAEKKLLFLPGQLLDGIEPSDDPMIDIRNSAYAESFSRRNP